MMNFGVEFIVLEIPQLKVKVFMETQSFNQPVQLYINFISNIAVSMKRSEERARIKKSRDMYYIIYMLYILIYVYTYAESYYMCVMFDLF